MVCGWFVDGLCVVCAWFVRGLCVVCAWFVRGLCVVCAWFVRVCECEGTVMKMGKSDGCCLKCNVIYLCNTKSLFMYFLILSATVRSSSISKSSLISAPINTCLNMSITHQQKNTTIYISIKQFHAVILTYIIYSYTNSVHYQM
jgi:hypothetical protein